MRNGTQEELDAAREDATLLPFDAIYKTRKSASSSSDMPHDMQVVRGCSAGFSDLCGTNISVAFRLLDATDYWYVSASDLEVINA